MALITCPECGKQISEYAPACVSCGVPMEMIKKLNAVIDLSPESTSAVAENNEAVPQEQTTNSEYITADQMKSRIIRCIICGTNFDITDYHCPKCNYSVLSLSPSPDSNLISSVHTKYRGEIDLTQPLLTRVYTSDEHTKLRKTVSANIAKNLASEYEKYAEQGNIIAKTNLGIFYCYGCGVKKDSSLAVELIKDAAEKDFGGAQYWLGIMYLYGFGVDKNLEKQQYWFHKAAENGNAPAQHFLGIYYDSIKKDTTKAAEWHRKAAEQGYAPAQNSLGVFYRNGQGVEKDYIKAVEWFYKAAEQEYAFAQINIGALYENGQGIEKDYTKAAEWYCKAAAQGNKEAEKNLQN